jgi:hypothetical protein
LFRNDSLKQISGQTAGPAAIDPKIDDEFDPCSP